MAFISSWRWYGVRTLSQTVITAKNGEPVDEDSAVYNESICIVKAQSHEQACKIAERRAKSQKVKYKNIYGQTVTQKYLAVIDCYYFEEEPEAGTQVYTCQYKLPGGESSLADLIQRLTQRR